MLYAVTGFPRTGTSLVMQCLQAAGVPLSYSVEREKRLQADTGSADYRPNPHGFFEHEWQDLRRLGFTASIPEGHAVKLRLMDLIILTPRPTCVIWMHRDWDQVRTSYERARFRKDPGVFDDWPLNAIEMETRNREIIDDRACVSHVIDIEFDRLVADPVHELARIPGVDAADAATAVRAELHRHKSLREAA